MKKENSRQVHHVRIGTDSHGTAPTDKEIAKIKNLFETAARKIKSKDEFVVTDARVDIHTLPKQR